MEKRSSGNVERPRKFQISVGDEIVYVEVISLNDRIYSVEFPEREPIFITRITSLDNKSCWVSIPHGANEMAELIGYYIEKHLDVS